MRHVAVKDLSITLGGNTILNSVSLPFQSKGIHGIVGENGAGKTTLLNCLAGYYHYKGEIIKTNIESMGYLPAELYMYPRITGWEFIVFCLNAKKCKVDKSYIRKMNEIFMLPLDRYAQNYSTGMLKKLHLMVLILQQNQLLLLDEPFNGLDTQSTIYITEFLKKIKTEDTIIIISSHLLHHLIDFCDTISFVANQHIEMFTNKSDFSNIVQHFEDKAKEILRKLSM